MSKTHVKIFVLKSIRPSYYRYINNIKHLLCSPYSSWLYERGIELHKLHIKPANELSLHWSRFDDMREDGRKRHLEIGSCSRCKQGKRLSYRTQ